jgi:Kef-type K+ transport system membrane component KefB
MDAAYASLVKIFESYSLSTRTIIYLGILLVLAYIVLTFMRKIRMPAVVGYVFLGILISPMTLKFFPIFPHQFFVADDMVRKLLDFIPDLALAFVAFIIGYELRIDVMKRQGKSIVIIVILEAFLAFLLVFLGTWWFLAKFGGPKFSSLALPIGLILGAVASATAPPATVMVLKEYHARGPLTSTILSVVGMDDAASLMIYSFAAPTVAAIFAGISLTPANIILHSAVYPTIEITLTLVIGFFSGLFWLKLLSKADSHSVLVIGVMASIIFNAGIADILHYSPLLLNMAAGFASSNFMKKKIDFDSVLDTLMEPLYALLFIISGMKLDIGLFGSLMFVMLGMVYLFARIGGKIFGASVGAIIGKAEPSVRKYVGFGLMSQVGVAIALAYQVERQFPQHPILGSTVFNVLLFTTIFTEIIGPIAVKKVIFLAKEAQVTRPEFSEEDKSI